jgi:hypothetical protein
VSLARKSSWLGASLQPLRSAEVEPQDGVEQVAPWRASVDALASLLSGARGRVEIIVSNHFARYVLVPWSESLVRDGERLAFARLAFREVYGAPADAWEVCLDDAPAGKPMLASAIDRELLVAIRGLTATSGLSLEAVIPSMADCINRHRRALKKPGFCLTNVEPGRLTFAFWARGQWLAVRSRRVDGSIADQLPTLVKQEASAAGVAEGGILYLCAPRVREYAGTPVPGWQLKLLDDVAPAAPPIVPPTLVGMES